MEWALREIGAPAWHFETVLARDVIEVVDLYGARVLLDLIVEVC